MASNITMLRALHRYFELAPRNTLIQDRMRDACIGVTYTRFTPIQESHAVTNYQVFFKCFLMPIWALKSGGTRWEKSARRADFNARFGIKIRASQILPEGQDFNAF